jgi:hypothetical protein
MCIQLEWGLLHCDNMNLDLAQRLSMVASDILHERSHPIAPVAGCL